LPLDVRERFQEYCSERLTTASDEVRQFILYRLREWEHEKLRMAEKQARVRTAERVHQQVAAQKQAVSTGSPLEDALAEAEQAFGRKLTRQERRAIERDVEKGRL